MGKKYNRYMNIMAAVSMTLVSVLAVLAIIGVCMEFHETLGNLSTDTECGSDNYLLGEDIYEVNGESLLINSDDIYDIESKFIWYSSRNFGNYRVYDSSSLTAEILEHRAGKGTVIVERCIGYVTDGKTGDGLVINTDSKNNFISFKDVGLSYKTGTVFVTYMVYADNNYIDDAERYDFVLTRDYEVSE